MRGMFNNFKRGRDMRIDTDSLTVTHVYDGEEVVTGGPEGQAWVATFSSANLARMFITDCKRMPTIDVPEDDERLFVAKRFR